MKKHSGILTYIVLGLHEKIEYRHRQAQDGWPNTQS